MDASHTTQIKQAFQAHGWANTRLSENAWELRFKVSNHKWRIILRVEEGKTTRITTALVNFISGEKTSDIRVLDLLCSLNYAQDEVVFARDPRDGEVIIRHASTIEDFTNFDDATNESILNLLGIAEGYSPIFEHLGFNFDTIKPPTPYLPTNRLTQYFDELDNRN